MTSGSFEKTNFSWQFQQFRWRISEWLEQLTLPPEKTPQGTKPVDWSLPDWLLKLLFWVLVGLVAGWAIWQLYRLLRPVWGGFGSAADRYSTPSPTKNLTVSQCLQRSRALAQQGNYREACRMLYLAALQRLDEAKVVPQQVSRTDGEYLNCLHPLTNDRPYRVLIQTHEQLCFSSRDISAETFDRCEQAYQEIASP